MVFVFRVSYKEKKPNEEEAAEKPKARMDLPTPVRTEQADPRKAVLYLITAILDAEAERGFVGADMVQRQKGRLVLTDKANQAVETISIPKQRPEVVSEAIDNLVWDDRTLKSKAAANKSIGNIWKALSTGKPAIISFKSEESADLAADILHEAGFDDTMIKRISKHSIKIVGLPEEFNLDALKGRLANNLTRIKEDAAAAENKEAEEARAAAFVSHGAEIDEENRQKFGYDPEYDGRSATQAARDIARSYQDHMTSAKDKHMVWYYLNIRSDATEIEDELQKLPPFNGMSLNEFAEIVSFLRMSIKPEIFKIVGRQVEEAKKSKNAESRKQEIEAGGKFLETGSAVDLALYLGFRPENKNKGLGFSDYAETAYSWREETPLNVEKTATGREHEELKAYERERRGGALSMPEIAAATPWEIPPAFRQQLERGGTTLFYTFPSAARYAEARATVEALFPGRAVAVEHTPEFERGRDIGEWVMTVLPPGQTSGDAIEVSASIRGRVGPSVDSKARWVHEGKSESLSFASIASDAVSNYTTYTTEVLVDPAKPSEIPAWFKSIAIGTKADKIDARPEIKRTLLVKGVELRMEVARTIENDDGTTSYVYKITVSGENVRKPLEIARNSARPKKKEAPEPKLKEVRFGEEEVAANILRERLDRFRKKIGQG